MRTVLIGIAVAVCCGALGVGAAYGGSVMMKACRPQNAAVRTIRPPKGPGWNNHQPPSHFHQMHERMFLFQEDESGK